ncbi:MAG: hypothetical protein IT288_16330 [Bdellovibrionales bacterium]|nr:hypothetical protein [Bdellovibrionales bacterium]
MSLIILVLYLVLQLVVCFFISRKIESEEDYLVAGRNLPLSLISISLFATWFGAETCIGSSAAVFADGIAGSRADPFGYTLCLVLSGVLIAPRLWNRKYSTLADFYRERFGNGTQTLAAWLISFSSLIWAAAQLRAFSQVVAATTELPSDLTLLLGLIFVLAYTGMAGLMGDVVTDVIQAIMMTLGLLVLFAYTVPHVDSVVAALWTQQPAERLSFLSAGESWWARADRWAIPILGSLVAQEVASRIFASHTRSIAVKSCLVGAGLYLTLGSIPVVLGLMGPSLITMEGNNEQFLIHLAQRYMPWFLVPLLAGAIISALLSTIDSILISVGGLVAHNVLIPKFQVQDEKTKLNINRAVVMAAGLIAYVMAVYSQGILELLELASSFGSAGILIITLLGLWTPLGNNRVATFTLLAGLVATPVAEYWLEFQSPFLFSIAVSLVVFLTTSAIRMPHTVEP